MASLSGPNSRRRLGTVSGDMRREARKLERSGNSRAAQAMALGAAEQRATEGSAIGNSANREAFERKQQATDRGLMETKRRALLSRPAAEAAPTSAVPPLLARPAEPRSLSRPLQGPPAPQREGLIDGKPASQVLGGLRRRQDGEPGNMGDVQRRTLSGVPILGGVNDDVPSPTIRGLLDEVKGARAGIAESLASSPPRELAGPPAPAAITPRELAGPPASTMGASAAPAEPVPAAAPQRAIKRTLTTPNVGTDGFVSTGAPFSAARKKYREEEAKGLKAPLRSATLAVGAGLSRFGRDIKNSYK